MSRRTPGTAANLTPRELQALERIDCADGMSVPELMVAMRVAFQTAHEHLASLVRVGQATRVKAPGVAHKRFFRQPHHAAAWLESHEAVQRAEAAKAAALRAEKAAARDASMSSRTRQRRAAEARKAAAGGPDWATINKPAGKAPPVPMRQVVPTNPRGVQPTVIATPIDTRFCVGPDETPPAVFRRYAPGVNPMTGEAWGVAA